CLGDPRHAMPHWRLRVARCRRAVDPRSSSAHILPLVSWFVSWRVTSWWVAWSAGWLVSPLVSQRARVGEHLLLGVVAPARSRGCTRRQGGQGGQGAHGGDAEQQ